MDEQRIERALRLGPLDEPAYTPLGTRRHARDADANAGLGRPERPTASSPLDALERPSTPTGLEPLRPVGVRVRRHDRPARPSLPLTIAAAIAVLVGGLLLVPGVAFGPAATPAPSPDLLGRIVATGSIDVAVSNAAPQTLSQGAAYVGFDVDVARAIAEQLGVRANVHAVAPGSFSAGSWDMALPGHGAGTLDAVEATQPYAYWPIWLATAVGSSVTDVASLDSARVCVVGGSAGADWLAREDGSPPATAPAGAQEVVAGSDDECIAAVGDGRADAMLTTTMLGTEIQARGLRLVDPDPVVLDPWAVVVRGPAPDVATLVAAVDDAISTLRGSGRLADLSRAAFGGRDVTAPTP